MYLLFCKQTLETVLNWDPLYYNLVDKDDESNKSAIVVLARPPLPPPGWGKDPDAVIYEEEDFADNLGDRTLITEGIYFKLLVNRFECQ